jgi:phospholipid/cholesterol/gamma-HCH transport system substrate-binding protein
MDLHYRREVTVGPIVLLALVIFVAGTMWLRVKSFHAGDLIHIQFANIGNLKEASAVQISGYELGKVQSIEFMQPGKVIGNVAVDPKVQMRKDASAKIITLSLAAGDAAVDLTPGAASAPLGKGDTIMGSSEAGFTDIAGKLAARADGVMAGVPALVDPEMTKQLRATMASLQKTLDAAQQTMALYGDPNRGPTAELTRTMTEFRQLGARLDSTLANPGLQRALAGSDSLVQNLSAMSKNLTATGDKLNAILTDVQAGKGTFGKLAKDGTLYHNLTKMTAQLDSVMQVIKQNPGKIPITVKIF